MRGCMRACKGGQVGYGATRAPGEDSQRTNKRRDSACFEAMEELRLRRCRTPPLLTLPVSSSPPPSPPPLPCTSCPVRIPLYASLKLLCFAWLVLPESRGAALLYTHYLRRFALLLISRRPSAPPSAAPTEHARVPAGTYKRVWGVGGEGRGKEKAGEEGEWGGGEGEGLVKGVLSVEQQRVFEGLDGATRDLVVEYVKDNGQAALAQALTQVTLLALHSSAADGTAGGGCHALAAPTLPPCLCIYPSALRV